jgi:hypothetical protein
LTGYDSGSRYSLATGLGSVDGTQLINEWESVTRVPTTTSLQLSKTSFKHGQSVEIESTVTPAPAAGNVAITNKAGALQGATTSPAPTILALKNGSASGSYSQFPGGAYDVYADYSGDGASAGSTSKPVRVTVAPEDSVLQIGGLAVSSNGRLNNIANKTVPLGATITFNAKPIGESQLSSKSPIADATGTVYFYDYLNGDDGLMIDSPAAVDATGNAEVNTSMLASGSHEVIAEYSGDWSYNTSNSPPLKFTISSIPTSIAVLANGTTILSGGMIELSGQLTANVPVNSLSPFGQVTFTNLTNNTVIGTGDVGSGASCQNAKTMCIDATIDVYSNSFANGSNSVIATYSGDSNYQKSGPSKPITITCTAGCWNAKGWGLYLSFYQLSPGGIISPGGTITANVAVTSTGGFTGAVNVSCSIVGKSAGDTNIPTCSFDPRQVKIVNAADAVESALAISTTAGTSLDEYTINFKAADAATGTITAADYFSFTVN